MTEFRREIEKAASTFAGEFTVTDIRKHIGWEDTIRVYSRIRYSLDRMGLNRKSPHHTIIYSRDNA